ncbi:hypothetical protein G6N74_30320 [Mesorhizobium sp. CGMCC 1.15528]|uniref:Uncharacterized protein n=1 Tax=Mesorhizobium zhangyense TaxID=1776730 RepID=A0A7C9RC00_9HYPH|nr:hypothetical protein [Mesorhizobium zhangyense]NGN45341.1 hypothetical protein [Mesorhizobium zhangyense]
MPKFLRDLTKSGLDLGSAFRRLMGAHNELYFRDGDYREGRPRAGLDQDRLRPQTIGRVFLVIDEGNNSRQDVFIFETAHDVTKHPLYAKAMLSQAFGLTEKALSDGPVLQFGAEVTVGG